MRYMRFVMMRLFSPLFSVFVEVDAFGSGLEFLRLWRLLCVAVDASQYDRGHGGLTIFDIVAFFPMRSLVRALRTSCGAIEASWFSAAGSTAWKIRGQLGFWLADIHYYAKHFCDRGAS